MATLYSDPSLTETTVETGDLFLGLRPVLNATGQVSGYLPYNITAPNFATSLVSMGLIALGQTLPTTAPAGGGLYLNGVNFAYSPVTGGTSSLPLTPEALVASIKAMMPTLPVTNPGIATDLYNNDGAIVSSEGPDVS